jgi:Na+/H+ antiporter NhaC
MRLSTFSILTLLFLFPLELKSYIIIKEAKTIYLSGVEYEIMVERPINVEIFFQNENGEKQPFHITHLAADSAQKTQTSTAAITFKRSGSYFLTDGKEETEPLRVIPGWFSLLAPVAAILLALITKQVLIALFAGVWLGATFIYDYNPLNGFLMALTEYIAKAPADYEKMAIIIFSLVLGGMVGIISKSGGTKGIVEKLSSFAANRRKGQLSVWAMGILIFFDDYANTLIVGNTMRPLTDRLKISREKLAYLVDSTAAPVANIAVISTWIGYQLSLINDAFEKVGYEGNAYVIFFKTIPYNFYPILTLIFGLFIILLNRDFFSMHKAELRAVRKGEILSKTAAPLSHMNSEELAPKQGAPLRWYNGFIPVLFVVLTTFIGLWFSGLSSGKNPPEHINGIEYISFVIGNSDSFAALMWAAFIGSIIAAIMAIWQKILTLNEAITAWVGGIKAMVVAALILTMAWAIGDICSALQTADFVIHLTKGYLSVSFLPTISFIIAALVAFSTGTSWGAMAILTPIVIPMSIQLTAADPTISAGVASAIFLGSIGSILAGATFGDHCSPISDTTIMASMASSADHIDHVKTQLPYALTVGAVSIGLGYIPIGFGFPSTISMILGVITLAFVIRIAGKKNDDTISHQ